MLLSLPSPPRCWASPRTELNLGKEGSAPLGLLSTSRDEAPCSCWVSSFTARCAYTLLSTGALLPCGWLRLPKPVARVPAVTPLLVSSSTRPAVSLWAASVKWITSRFALFWEISNNLKFAFGLSKNKKLLVLHIK